MSSDDIQALGEGFKLDLSFALVGTSSLDIASRVDELFALLCGERVSRFERNDALVLSETADPSLFDTAR